MLPLNRVTLSAKTKDASNRPLCVVILTEFELVEHVAKELMVPIVQASGDNPADNSTEPNLALPELTLSDVGRSHVLVSVFFVSLSIFYFSISHNTQS